MRAMKKNLYRYTRTCPAFCLLTTMEGSYAMEVFHVVPSRKQFARSAVLQRLKPFYLQQGKIVTENFRSKQKRRLVD